MPAAPTSPVASIPLRHRLILDYLLDAGEDVTAEDIAHMAATSVRTIRRDLPEIEKFLHHYRLGLQRKAGTGLLLEGTGAARENLRQDLSASPIGSIRPSDRHAWLACTLLATSEPVKLHSLANDLEITITTAGSDLDALEPWFASYHLTLQRKRGWGVALEGVESDRRNAIVDLFFSQFDEPGRHALFDEASHFTPSSADLLLRPAWLLVKPERFRTVARLLRELDEVQRLPLEPAERLEFAFHVALLLQRAGDRQFCEPVVTPAAPTQDAASLAVSWLAPRLAALLPAPLPVAETERLRLLLRGTADPLSPPGPQLLPQVQDFLVACDARFNAPLSADPTLLDGLLPHLTRALHRLQNHLPIRNPLLQEIRENYQVLFSRVRAAADEVFISPTLPDTEIGFLVLHVGSALERRRHRRWRALVVCSAGVGTSRMLASRLRTELPEIEIADLLSWQDAARSDPADYDVVLSTIPLEWPRERYLVVSPLLQEKDVRQITAFLARRELLPARGPARTADEAVSPAKLDYDRHRATFIRVLLREWRVHDLPAQAGNVTDLVPAICRPLGDSGLLADLPSTISHLANRIGQSSLVIPGSRLAFMHTREAGIARASISLHRLARPLPIGNETVVEQCLLMLAPLKLHRAEVAVLSRISSLLMETATLEILARGDEAESRAYLARQLAGPFRE